MLDHTQRAFALVGPGRAGTTLALAMTPGEVRASVTLVRDARADVLVEVSGGITLENVRAYADAGADVVSTSVITQSAPALDIGFDIAVTEGG